MKTPTLIASAILLSLPVNAFNIKQDLQPGPVTLEIARDSHLKARQETPLDGAIEKRVVEEALGSELYYYYANVSIGTPAQFVRVQISSLESDTWVNTLNSTNCFPPCTKVNGTYSANASSTYNYLNSNFTITYADGTNASGDWATDTFSFGGTSVKQLQFAVAYNSTTTAVLGLGPQVAESTLLNFYPGTSYENLPVLLHQKGIINCSAYSLYLGTGFDTGDKSVGRLIFGGVDTNKFYGNLESLSIGPSETSGISTISLAQMNMTLNGETVFNYNQAIAVSPDSGFSFMTLPTVITAPIFSKLNATWDPDPNSYSGTGGTTLISCDSTHMNTSFSFLFGSTTITVPMAELVYQYNSSFCQFAMTPNDGNFVLGLSFLRSAYVVYDFTQNIISLAPTNSNSTSENVTALPSLGVVGAGLVGASRSASTSTGLPSPTKSSTTSINIPTSDPTPAPALTTGAKAGIGVGASAAGLAIIGLAGYFILRRRRQGYKPASTGTSPSTRPGSFRPYRETGVEMPPVRESTQRQSQMPYRD